MMYAFRVWIFALVVFLGWLAMMLLSGDEIRGKTGRRPLAAVTFSEEVVSPTFILEDLFSMAEPVLIPSFGEDSPYVLTAFAKQGFYQGDVPKTASETILGSGWTLEYPGQTLSAQLIQRDPSPRVVTEAVRLQWELEPLAGLQSSAQIRGGIMEASDDGVSFSAAIPVSARRLDESLNPYPLVTVIALDENTGEEIARTSAVLAISPGFGCTRCHQSDLALLETHDRHNATGFAATVARGGVVACRSCHTGPSGEEGRGLSVSAAVHGWHAFYLSEQKEDACLSCHIGLGRGAEEAPAKALFARDLHTERGLGCVRCHGVLEDHALALLKAEADAGQVLAKPALERIQPQAVSTLDEIMPRLPWVQEPDCGACHDFEEKPAKESCSAFGAWTSDESGLFRNSTDYSTMVRCSSCHGAPHALYPAFNPLERDRDNIVPLQYQQQARPLGGGDNCAVCHTMLMDFSVHHPLVEDTE